LIIALLFNVAALDLQRPVWSGVDQRQDMLIRRRTGVFPTAIDIEVTVGVKLLQTRPYCVNTDFDRRASATDRRVAGRRLLHIARCHIRELFQLHGRTGARRPGAFMCAAPGRPASSRRLIRRWPR
jgi:hypothetical protein